MKRLRGQSHARRQILPPALAAISPNKRTEIGANWSFGDLRITPMLNNEKPTSEGLTTTLFPAAKAGAIFLTAISNGWLKGYLWTVSSVIIVKR